MRNKENNFPIRTLISRPKYAKDFSIVLLIDTLMVFLKKKLKEKDVQTIKKHLKYLKLPNMQRLRLSVVSSILNARLSVRA